MGRTSRRIDDPLWKAVLEQTFVHFLQFMFPEADGVFDFSRPFDYLDKEFESLFPPEANGKGVRYVDKLVKVFLKEGGEQFVLCHIEVQSSKSNGDLAKRMFQYFYRISDRYKVPVTAIAILADGNKSYRPRVYIQQFMGTTLRYDFNSYKILDQDESALRANANPFSVVVLTALLAILHKNITDAQLKDIKHDLYEEMMAREMDKQTRQGLYDFLAYYVSFDNQDSLIIFEQELKEKLGRSNTMGTREYLLDKAEKQGIEKGKVEGEREKAIAIALEFKKMGLPVVDIAKGTGLSVEDIEKL
ncbi:Rpn family recombination-promoting nuclease/putative transposase [Sphingobacterium sp. R2]|uniref:Rpn family recombination-promoting nuclease/putative transposase n=1 Tax=Sphingobacterium sp. R2 TaxID=3112958 RepID=UPI00345C93EE